MDPVLTWAIAALVVLVAIGWLLRQRERSAQIVYPWEHGLLYEDGAFVRVVGPGRLVLWPRRSRRALHRVGSYDQFDAGSPIDVLSADRFVFRVTIAAVYRISDPRAAFENPVAPRLRTVTTGAAAEWTAARTLEAILADRQALATVVKERLVAALPDITVSDVQVPAVALPPEVRRLFTEVERAKLESQATLERARGEQAALRALANAARMLKDNPDLMRLRTLQAVSPTGKGATLVLGPDALSPIARPAP